jgi:nucleoside-diphosphate-sugar epimerase
MAKILIAGCGDVGSRLAIRLADAGHDVFGLRRSSFTLPGVTTLQGDLTRPDSLSLPDGLDIVVILLSPDGYDADAYRRTYHDGTQNLLQALSGQHLRHVFWVSSTSVYGQADGSVVDEESPANPASATARVLLESEALVRNAHWSSTIVRCSGLYGPERLRLLRWIDEGRPVQAEPPLWTNRLHVDDAAGILSFLIVRSLAGIALQDLYIGTDELPAQQHEVLDWIADRMCKPRVAHEMLKASGCGKRLSSQRLALLGYTWQFPDFRSGYETVIQSLAAH